MTKRSTLLKVATVLNLVLGIIATIAMAVSLARISAAGALVGAGLSDLLQLGAATSGINPNLIMPAVVLSLILGLSLVVSGVLGIVSKNVRTLSLFGLVLIFIAIVTFILNCAAGGFSALGLVSFVLPILYFIGAKKCIQ